MFMVDSSSVLLHILQAALGARQWDEHFHLNNASAILGKTGISPRMSGSFAHGTAVGPSARSCNVNEHIPYDLVLPTAWDMLNVVAIRTVKDPLPQNGQSMLSRAELRAQCTQRDAADADRREGGDDEPDATVPHLHLQQLRSSVLYITNNFPEARGSPQVLEALSPLIAAGSLEEVRLMFLSIIQGSTANAA
jgi:hypothetical protein